MPEQGVPATPKDENLTLDETARIVRVAASLGMRKVRLTGGEPLLRKELPELVRQIAEMPGIEDLSCTTNGFLLSEMAGPLAKAGLTRVNVSLDTLRPDRFVSIARRGSIEAVLKGIEAARQAGLDPIKVNCVAMKGFNDDEAPDFARWTLQENIHVRFIEIMPMRWNLDETPDEGFKAFDAHRGQGLLQLKEARGDMLSDSQMRRLFVSAAELRSSIESRFGPLEPAEVQTNGPARSYRIPGAVGTIGFISQISFDFCEKCNRLRLTHDGFLRPCLMSDGELDLRTVLRVGASDEEIADLIRHVVEHKPERHYLASGQTVKGRGMSQIGG
jgi:cyclic pyranopterin phosphate synthase